jgi:hypothetical protein
MQAYFGSPPQPGVLTQNAYQYQANEFIEVI